MITTTFLQPKNDRDMNFTNRRCVYGQNTTPGYVNHHRTFDFEFEKIEKENTPRVESNDIEKINSHFLRTLQEIKPLDRTAMRSLLLHGTKPQML